MAQNFRLKASSSRTVAAENDGTIAALLLDTARGPDQPMLLGRAPGVELLLPAGWVQVSSKHCKIWCQDEEQGIFVVEDSSTNGTFVNQQRLKKGQSATLSIGDTLQLAVVPQGQEEQKLTFQLERVPAEAAGSAVMLTPSSAKRKAGAAGGAAPGSDPTRSTKRTKASAAGPTGRVPADAGTTPATKAPGNLGKVTAGAGAAGGAATSSDGADVELLMQMQRANGELRSQLEGELHARQALEAQLKEKEAAHSTALAEREAAHAAALAEAEARGRKAAEAEQRAREEAEAGHALALEEAAQARQEAESREGELKQQVEQLEAGLQEAQQAGAESAGRVQQLEQEAQRQQAALQAAQDELSKLQQALQQAQEESQAQRTAVAQLRRDLAAATAAAEQSAAAQQELDRQLQAAQEGQARAQQELEAVRAAAAETKRQAAQAQRELASLALREEGLKERHAVLQSLLESINVYASKSRAAKAGQDAAYQAFKEGMQKIDSSKGESDQAYAAMMARIDSVVGKLTFNDGAASVGGPGATPVVAPAGAASPAAAPLNSCLSLGAGAVASAAASQGGGGDSAAQLAQQLQAKQLHAQFYETQILMTSNGAEGTSLGAPAEPAVNHTAMAGPTQQVFGYESASAGPLARQQGQQGSTPPGSTAPAATAAAEARTGTGPAAEGAGADVVPESQAMEEDVPEKQQENEQEQAGGIANKPQAADGGDEGEVMSAEHLGQGREEAQGAEEEEEDSGDAMDEDAHQQDQQQTEQEQAAGQATDAAAGNSQEVAEPAVSQVVVVEEEEKALLVEAAVVADAENEERQQQPEQVAVTVEDRLPVSARGAGREAAERLSVRSAGDIVSQEAQQVQAGGRADAAAVPDSGATADNLSSELEVSDEEVGSDEELEGAEVEGARCSGAPAPGAGALLQPLAGAMEDATTGQAGSEGKENASLGNMIAANTQEQSNSKQAGSQRPGSALGQQPYSEVQGGGSVDN